MNTVQGILFGFMCILSLIVSGSLIAHLVLAVKQIKRRKGRQVSVSKKSAISNNLSVILAAANEEETIADTLDSLLAQRPFCIEEIIIVISNSKDNTTSIAKEYSKIHQIIKVVLTKSTKGKIGALIKGLHIVKNNDVILIDSDILLSKNCFHLLLAYHREQKADYTTCIIDPITPNQVIPKFISCNRLFRQRILRPARDYFGISNVPGNLILVNKNKYLSMLEESTGISDDICSTFQLIMKGEKVNVLYLPLAGEKERLTFKGLISQRTRWSLGFLDSLNYYLEATSRLCIKKKLFLLSYPSMWYLVYLLSSILFLLSFFSYFYLFLFIIVNGCYFLCVYKAKQILPIQKFNIFDVILHALFFHFFVTLSFIKALYIINVTNRVNLFYKKSLYKRN